MSGLYLEDLVDPFKFFQGVHDAPEFQLDENQLRRALRPRASALQSCAREQAYSMHGVPLSDPQRENPEQVAQQYANEQGRVAEAISFAALQWQPDMPVRVAVVNRQVSTSAEHFASGHPDGELVWLLPDEDLHELMLEDDARGFLGQWAAFGIPPERFLFKPSMFGRTDDEDDGGGYRIGVEHKHPGVNTYGRVLGMGLEPERPGWVVQAIVYGMDRGWDYVLLIDVALDATSVGSPRLGYTKYLKTPFDKKLNAKLMDIRGYKLAYGSQLRKRAEALSAVEDPGTVAREFDGKMKFPCQYCEYQTRCNIDGDGDVVIPPSPFKGA